MNDKDYTHLEGKIIECINSKCNYMTIKVAVIDYDIGISCVDLNNPDKEMLCINGELSPNKWLIPPEVTYHKFFHFLIECFEDGIFEDSEWVEIIRLSGDGTTGFRHVCAYK